MEPLKQGSYTRTQGAPQADNAIVMFHKEPIQDHAASAREGRPIFFEKEMIEIRLPGNPHSVWDLPVTDEHREKYSRAYEAFLRGEEMAADGTPIEQLTILNRAQIKELKFLDIHTVEAAAALDDRAIQRFQGGFKLRELAKKYLEQAAGFAPLATVVEENDKLKAQLAAQAVQIEELNKLMVGMQSQLNNYAVAPKVPEYVHPGAFGGQPVTEPAPAPVAPPVARSSLESIGAPQPKRRGRPPKNANAAVAA